jgi:hypothetical protein
MSGGKEANLSGKSWEAFVEVSAKQCYFTIIPFSQRSEHHNYDRVIWSHVPYTTIYNNLKKQAEAKTATEYVVKSGVDLVRIECKWQNVSGSVDEKFPFLYLNAVLTMPEPTVIFALGGAYFESGRGAEVRQWLKRACTIPPHWLSDEAKALHARKELRVETPNTFNKWFRERFSIK